MQTIFIVLAVAIGVAVIVFMSAMLASLQANFIKRALTSQPHIQLIPPDEVARPLREPQAHQILAPVVQRPAQRIRSIDQWQKIRAFLASWPDIVTISPTMTTSALAVRGDASRSISLTGIDPELYFEIVRVPDYIVQGHLKERHCIRYCATRFSRVLPRDENALRNKVGNAGRDNDYWSAGR